MAAGWLHSVAIECEIAPSSSSSPELAPFSFSAPRTWTATGIRPTSSGATLTIAARGNLGASTRFLTVRIDGVVLATNVFGAGSGASNCTGSPATATIAVPAAQFSSLTADGELEIRVEPSINATSAGCPDATLSVTLDYLRDAVDCNGNGVDDDCEIEMLPAERDCNLNGALDGCEILNGAEDKNLNGQLDSCELARGDLDLDGAIGGADLAALLALWGVPGAPYGDLDGDGDVNGADLAILLSRWGPVP